MSGNRVLQLSLKLEAAFKLFSCDMPFDRDTICIKPTEAVEAGLRWLYADGIINEQDFSMMREEYSWGTMTLEDAVTNCNAEETICELIRRLEKMVEKK